MYKRIVILTGAGISAESGIGTFRDNDGLWEKHRLEDVATPEAFEANPQLVYRFYNERRKQLLSDSVAPNKAHIGLALLAQQHPDEVTIITQNVDNLHERAGSHNVLHMHGELLSYRCTQSLKVVECFDSFDQYSRCNCCSVPAKIRPNIVWFGEMPLYMTQIQQLLRDADLFISIGTSGNVYPAAGFVAEAAAFGAYTVELNLEPSQVNADFAEHMYGKASEIVPLYLQENLNVVI